MNHVYYKYAVWATLNVLLPVGASAVTYFIAMLADESATRDALIVQAFSGGDNFLIAAILYAIVMFEIEDDSEVSQRARLCLLACFLMCLGMLGAYLLFKQYSFSATKSVDRQYYIGVTSLAAIGLSATLALAAKVFILGRLGRRAVKGA